MTFYDIVYVNCTNWLWCFSKWVFSMKDNTNVNETKVPILRDFQVQIRTVFYGKYVCFVCFHGIYRPTRECFTHMETSPLRVKGCNFDLCSALMAIEQWGFFNVELLRHGPTVYNGHLRGHVTLTPLPSSVWPVAERLAVELSLPVFTTYVCQDRGSSTLSLSHRGGLYEN